MAFERKATRRTQGEGTLYHDASRGRWVWQGSITAPDGTRTRPMVVGDTAKDVLERVTVLKATRGMGHVAPSEQTVGNYLLWWLENARASVSHNTKVCYRGIVTRHLRNSAYGLSDMRLDKVTTFHLLDMRNAMERAGVGRRTQQLCHAVLHMAFRDAVFARLIGTNPAAGLIGVKVRTEKREPWVLEEAQRFLATAAKSELGPLFVVALHTGMRQGELLGLHWDQIDPGSSTLTVTRNAVEESGRLVEFGPPKSEESRRAIPYGNMPAVRAALAQQREWLMRHGLGAAKLVFPTGEGTVLLKSNLRRVYNRLIRMAGVRRITFHDLRHTAGSLMLTLGVEIKVIQVILGHEDIKMTADTYLHVGAQLKSAALGKLSSALAGVA